MAEPSGFDLGGRSAAVTGGALGIGAGIARALVEAGARVVLIDKDLEAARRTAFRLEGAETPVFDLVQLGMGNDGHTASLFPHTAALIDLSSIVVANHVPQQRDSWRITLTWPVINRGREVAFLIEGEGKAQVLHDVLLGAYDPEAKPSQLIRPESGWLTVMLDAAAAAELGLSSAGATMEIFG